MLIVERQDRLLEILRHKRAAQLEELARELSVSPSTVRRDLEALELRGAVERTHGGAVYKGNGETPQAGIALTARMAEHVEPKLAVGRCAAALVQPHMTLMLDGGSTVIYAARQIVARPIQVVTTSLTIANHFKDDDQVEVLMVGGNLYPRVEVTVGPITTATLADLHADLLLFSVVGIDGDSAFNNNLSMARVEQVMLRQAARSALLMDSSKFGRQSLARVCGIADIDRIITDAAVPDTWRRRLGDRLTVADG